MKKNWNEIKVIQILLCLITSTMLLFSCENKEENYIGELSQYIAIEDVRVLYKDNEVKLSSEKLNNAKKIYGVVVSDHSDKNIPSNLLVLQQNKRNRTRGIALHIENAATYLPGDSLVIDIVGKSLNKEGYLFIDGVTESNIEKISSGNAFTLRSTNASMLNSKPQDYESTIIRIIGGEMYPKPTEGETLSGSKKMINGADTISVVTLPEASFSAETLPRNINISGLALGSKEGVTKFNIFPRHLKDIEDISDPEVPEYIGANPLIITGFVNDPNGGDGNYEYIQLKSNTDINFSEVPFSLVLCTNAGTAAPNAGAAPGAGWATGGGRSYKFNLSQGSVKKGEYFYVGGNQRRINGPNSTLISSANWIRFIQYSANAGDGLGNSSSGLLPNSGNAGGIAVFIGVNVTEKSVPIDVVFFGGNSATTIVDVANEKGYRIGNNDHYHITNAEDGNLQPFFSMGNNTYRIPHIPTADIGVFVKLGGVFNTTERKWKTPRSYNFMTMTKASTLNEIESGEGTTLQID